MKKKPYRQVTTRKQTENKHVQLETKCVQYMLEVIMEQNHLWRDQYHLNFFLTTASY